MLLIGLVTFYLVKQSDFGINKWFLSYAQKCMKKNGLTRSAIISKKTEDFLLKIWHENFKIGYQIVWKLKFVSFELTEK